MATKSLLDKIEALPPEKKAEVEEFVDSLARRPGPQAAVPPRFPAELFDQINTERDALLKERGLLETQQILRDLRENGGR